MKCDACCVPPLNADIFLETTRLAHVLPLHLLVFLVPLHTLAVRLRWIEFEHESRPNEVQDIVLPDRHSNDLCRLALIHLGRALLAARVEVVRVAVSVGVNTCVVPAVLGIQRWFEGEEGNRGST